jgi:hypothetical protein
MIVTPRNSEIHVNLFSVTIFYEMIEILNKYLVRSRQQQILVLQFFLGTPSPAFVRSS